MVATAVLLALATQATLAAPSGAAVWAWDSTVPTCKLKHKGVADEGDIAIERTPGNDGVELTLTLARGSKVREGRFVDATVTVDTGRQFLADISISQSEVYVDAPDPDLIDHISDTTSLQISHRGMGSIKFPIRAPRSLVEALAQCEDEKMIAWGLDPIRWRSLKTTPTPLNHARSRFSALDYPATALRAGVEADAIVRLDVAPNGSVSACRALNRVSGSQATKLLKSFEAASCQVLKGTVFRPAIDSLGTPVSAPIVYDVRFRISE